jgi:toxin HigB-1
MSFVVLRNDGFFLQSTPLGRMIKMWKPEFGKMVMKVKITKEAEKLLPKLPIQVVKKLRLWVRQVELIGIREVRKIKGYHDEPLSGDREGQRSIRLNKAYRAFYIIKESGQVEIAVVFDINKHKY